MTDAKREQFARMMDQSIGLLRQSAVAATLAPQRYLANELYEILERVQVLKDDRRAWVFGMDSQGRVQSESGEFIGDINE